MRCSRPEVAFSSLRSLRHLLVTLACLALLAGCRFGGAVSYFDEDDAIAQAIGTLKQRIGTPVRVLNLAIEPDQLTIRALAHECAGHGQAEPLARSSDESTLFLESHSALPTTAIIGDCIGA